MAPEALEALEAWMAPEACLSQWLPLPLSGGALGEQQARLLGEPMGEEPPLVLAQKSSVRWQPLAEARRFLARDECQPQPPGWRLAL